MLSTLHIKNLALIEEEELILGPGLNILTGETGAGKSIMLGALSFALGQKVSKDMLRDPEKDGIVEAVFTVKNDIERARLSEMEVETPDDEVILSRRITENRAVAKINGETVPAQKLKEAGDILLDIHGQHEHQSLLHKKKHLELLDEYGKDEITPLKEKVASSYKEYKTLYKEYSEANVNESDRARELGFLNHEVEEIEEADLQPGEDEEVEELYRKMLNSQKIQASLQEAYSMTGGDNSAGDLIGRALMALKNVSGYDKKIEEFVSALSDADSIISDAAREMSDYISETEYDPGRFSETESRLNLINDLKNKYGKTIEDIIEAGKEKRERIEKLMDYDSYLSDLKKRLENSESALEAATERLTESRKKKAEELNRKVEEALKDLNFNEVHFETAFEERGEYSENGKDIPEFMISTNVGEPLRPLIDTASGGELSRIMLGIKTVLSENDTVDTMIFDEIDSGISGRTAQAVSEKLCDVARRHQVICITHLPQIASMADTHFLIEKTVEGDSTISGIKKLNRDESVEELARMLGGMEITDAVMKNAEEMKNLADGRKNG